MSWMGRGENIPGRVKGGASVPPFFDWIGPDWGAEFAEEKAREISLEAVVVRLATDGQAGESASDLIVLAAQSDVTLRAHFGDQPVCRVRGQAESW